jgi:predicted metal-dependent HD superfamily phosphohydrolase
LNDPMTQSLSNAAPLLLPDGMVDTLKTAHATPPRAYHNFSHVEDVLRRFDEVAAGPGWQRPREAFLAVLYHDAIYSPGRRDNETRSAELAREEIARWLPDAGIDADRVAMLIELTARHGRIEVADVDPEAALFLDCDMAILAADDAGFDAYDDAIATEYRGRMPGWMYRHNRRRFLQSLLNRERIFVSDYFHAQYDAVARANLRRAVAQRQSAVQEGAGR